MRRPFGLLSIPLGRALRLQVSSSGRVSLKLRIR